MKTSRQKDLLVFHGITEEGDYAASAYSSLSILHLVVLVSTVSTYSAVGHHHKSI